MRNWLIPSIAFFLFVYVLAILAIYTYMDTKLLLFEPSQNSSTTSIEDFKKELNKRIN
ncbi:MAG: hypothetical protein MR629_06940 [Helicobacter sp.]|uniref:hypothetical protein n=1 Tax=Helicobacter sp. 10-6591 TaxID=2004998 RepID=UPI0015EB6B05|nr:hypothetical protein [Helicobacter sp. 10-6591]MCI6218246.1 hypothetical protein [Helicobacter sp.]MCI7484941.1 hypothetical protein [Helicobacter sp.]MDD7568228.1 hypothetical protein [Helicobacter sp.]MDY5740274.1 hypothetical protein [Helicobacter sp.]